MCYQVTVDKAVDNEPKALIRKAKRPPSAGLSTEVFTKCAKVLIYKVKIKSCTRMDTFTRHARAVKVSRLGRYNARPNPQGMHKDAKAA